MADSSYLGNYMASDNASNGAVSNYVEVGDLGGGVSSVLWMAGSGAAAYHGYKRNGSVKWAIVWGLLGGLAPIITNGIALAQGFGKRKGQ